MLQPILLWCLPGRLVMAEEWLSNCSGRSLGADRWSSTESYHLKIKKKKKCWCVARWCAHESEVWSQIQSDKQRRLLCLSPSTPISTINSFKGSSAYHLKVSPLSLFKKRYLCVCIWIQDYRGQKLVSDPLELKLQVAMSCLTWALGTELWFSGRTVCILNW